MIKARTKNGVNLFISLCDDVFPNEGGYYCEVYLDEDMIEEFDNFVIHKGDLDRFEDKESIIQMCCDEYARGVDDMPILNKKFNAIYELITNVHEKVDEFYTQHFFCNKNLNVEDKETFTKLMQRMDSVRELSYEIAEHYISNN